MTAPFDVLLTNGRVVDGTSNPWFKADVAIDDGKIAALSRKIVGQADRVIDVSGLVIAPGFIDIHTHSDRAIITSNTARSSVMAGVTTEGVGNCGGSAYAFSPAYLEGFREWMGDTEVTWTDLKGYRDALERKGIGINIAPFVGHGTIRTSALGPEGKGGEKVIPSEGEMREMKRLVAEGMTQGAFGMTSGLWYPPGRNALTHELIELCRVVATSGGAYMSHIRGEAGALIESVREFIEICEKADIRGSISHHKAMGPQNWGKPCETIRLLTKARERGVEVMCDQYPWNYSSSANLGRWFISGWGRNPGIDGHYRPSKMDLETFLSDLENPRLWARIKREAQERYDVDATKNIERRRVMEKYGVTPSEVVYPRGFEYITHSKTHPELVGKRFFEVAEALGIDDYWDAIRKVLLDDEGQTFTGGGGMCDEDVTTILRFPACAVSTDGSTRDTPSTSMRPAHPRNYGSYAKVLQRYVREEHILTLEDAVRKMTGLPASFLGLSDRGLLRPGAWADLTIFDRETITNQATFARPDQYPTGIHYVLVNGEVAAEKGERTATLSGRVLRHPSPSPAA
jgi:N-acyl-D-amino-acid deacylase